MKINALVDRRCIAALYRASQAGVPVELNVRGICCLRPGVPGVSENIRVTSVVGRFLEHTRAYIFAAGDDVDVLIGSADLMPRNLDQRVELVAPVTDPRLQREIVDLVDLNLSDDANAWDLAADGSWTRRVPGEPADLVAGHADGALPVARRRQLRRVTAPKRTAVIDLGSNTFRLVVFEAGADPWWRRMDELPDRVRISEGAEATGRLGDEPMARALAALEIYGRYCEAQHLDEVHAVATSAIRDAENGAPFLERAREALGHQIRILSAEEEAFVGYVAAVNSSTLRDGAVLDLGGGSLQLSRVEDRRPAEAGSWPLGAVRMTERFLPDGVATKDGMKAVRRHAQKRLAKVDWLPAADRIVALGGAARNLAAAAAQDSGSLIAGGVQGVELTQTALADLRDRLADLDPGDRGRIAGINDRRADVILAAAIVLHEVLELATADRFEVTEWGMREGVFLASHLDAEPPVVPDVRRSAVEQLAHRFSPDLSHPRQVANLATALWDGLTGAGAPCAPEDRELVWAAGLLHDIGTAIDLDNRHWHSHYLVENAGLPGYSPREVALVASAAQFHHKGSPGLAHPVSQKGDEERLSRMAAVLRLAEDLDRARDGAVEDVRVSARNGSLRLGAVGDRTGTLLARAVERNGRLFRDAFGTELKAARDGDE